MTKVFISYSRNDMEFVQRLASDLLRAGLEVWWDLSDIQGSDVWERKIEEGLRTSQYFIVVLTPASLESRWVRREYLSADNKGIKIIPLKLKSYHESPLTLRDIQPIDAVGRPYEDILSDVLKILSENNKDKVLPSPVDRAVNTTTLSEVKSVNVNRLEVAGTISLLTFFLFLSFELLSDSSTELQVLAALSGLTAGYFLWRGRQIPGGVLFKVVMSLFFLTYDFLLLNNLVGWDISGVEIVAGIPAVLLAVVIIASIQTPKASASLGTMFFAVFIFLVSVYVGLNALGVYPSWPHIPAIVVSVLAAVLIWREM